MKSLHVSFIIMKTWWLTFLLLATLSLTGCGGKYGSAGPAGAPGEAAPGETITVTVQGNLIGDASPLTGPVSVVLVDEAGNVAASQTVTAANGNFSLAIPAGRSYLMLFRDARTGKAICPLVVNRRTGGIAFHLPQGSPDVNLGPVIFDSRLGRAWCRIDPPLLQATFAVPLDE